LMQEVFEGWMAERLKQNRPWDEIAAELITATGDIRQNGATALILARSGEPAEIAAEVSRIFLGIQIQCANCHDHPSDIWKREQFHQLAAFFPRIRLQPKLNSTPRTFEVVSLDSAPGGANGPEFFETFRQNPEFAIRRNDRNRDGKLTRAEVADGPLSRLFDRLLALG